MALENVVDSIRAQARKEADEALAQARRRAADVALRADAEAHALRERKARELRDAGGLLRKREIAAAELEARRMRLSAERALLLELRKGVETRLASLPPETRARHLRALSQRAPVGRLLVGARDRELASRLGRDLGTVEALGGVVVEAADGSSREDLRYETILDDVWQEHLREIAGILLEK